MDAKTIIGSLVGFKNLSDKQILKIWCTSKMVVDEQRINKSDDVLNFELEADKIKIIAALDIYEVLDSMPLMVSNIAKFKRLTMGMDYQNIIMLLLAMDKKENIDDRYKEYCDNLYNVCIENTTYKSQFKMINKAAEEWEYGTPVEECLSIPNKKLKVFYDMCGELYIPRTKLAEFCVDCYEGRPIIEIINDHFEGSFTKLPEADIHKKFSIAKTAVLSVSPIHCAQMLNIVKTNHYYATTLEGDIEVKSTVKTIRDNRSKLEQTFLLRVLKSVMPIDNVGRIILADTTSFFVEEAINKVISSEEVCIVSSSNEVIKLYAMQYSNPKYCGIPHDNIDYFFINDYFEEQKINEETVVIISENTLNQNEIIRLAKLSESMEASAIVIMGSDATIKAVLENSLLEGEVLVLPPLHNAPFGYQSLLILQKNIEMSRMHKFKVVRTESDKQILKVIENKVIIKDELQHAKTLRGYINFNKRNLRKTPELLRISNEICIYIAGIGSGRIQVYFKVNGRMKKESLAHFREKNESKKDIATKYLNSNIKRKNYKVNIKNLVKGTLIEQYGGHGISLMSVWLTSNTIEKKFNKRETKIMDHLMESALAEMNADYYSIKDLKEELNKLFANEQDKMEGLYLILRLSKISVNEGYTRKAFSEIDMTGMQYSYGRRNILEKLGRDSLKLADAKKLYAQIQQIEDKEIRTAIKLRLILGMEVNVICALTVGDIKYNEYLGTSQIVVNKKTNSLTGRIEPVIRDAQKRVLPIPFNLNQDIQELIAAKKKKDLLFFNEGKRIEAKTLVFETARIIKSLGYENEYIEVMNNKGETKKVDISVMNKDVMRGTMSFLARQFAGMDMDDICYVIGVRTHTTGGIHYTDFKSDYDQKILLKRLNRLEKIIM